MVFRNKIEEIRQKPEHIRMRYVWACVGISMILVLFVWGASFRLENFSGKGRSGISPDQKAVWEQLGQQTDSLKETGGNIKKSLDQAQKQTQEQFRDQSLNSDSEQIQIQGQSPIQNQDRTEIPLDNSASEGFTGAEQIEK